MEKNHKIHKTCITCCTKCTSPLPSLLQPIPPAVQLKRHIPFLISRTHFPHSNAPTLKKDSSDCRATNLQVTRTPELETRTNIMKHERNHIINNMAKSQSHESPAALANYDRKFKLRTQSSEFRVHDEQKQLSLLQDIILDRYCRTTSASVFLIVSTRLSKRLSR